MTDRTDPVATVIYDDTEIPIHARPAGCRVFVRARLRWRLLGRAMLCAPPWLSRLLYPVVSRIYDRKPDLFVTVEPVIPNG